MTLTAVLILASVLYSIGLYGVLSQRSLLKLMMGIELMVGGSVLTLSGLWSASAGGSELGSVLAVVFLTVMGVELAIGLALVTAVYRARRATTSEQLRGLFG